MFYKQRMRFWRFLEKKLYSLYDWANRREMRVRELEILSTPPDINGWRTVHITYGDHFTLKEWDPNCCSRHDGVGYWSTDTGYHNDFDVHLVKQPKWATHVMWFNK